MWPLQSFTSCRWIEKFYLNTIKQMFFLVEQIDQLGICLPFSKLLTGILILAVFQNLRWNSNKTSLNNFSYFSDCKPINVQVSKFFWGHLYNAIGALGFIILLQALHFYFHCFSAKGCLVKTTSSRQDSLELSLQDDCSSQSRTIWSKSAANFGKFFHSLVGLSIEVCK